MSDIAAKLREACTKNRAEELGQDVWQLFVIPHFYQLLDLEQSRKPKLFIAGRGSGKTMLMRYLSHRSAFSPRRSAIPTQEAGRIGLYWKVDSQFARALASRGLPEDRWEAAFDHALALDIGTEVLRSLGSIARSKCQVLSPYDLSQVRFEALGAFDPDCSCSIKELEVVLRQKRNAFQMWVNNPRQLQQPLFLPGRAFLLEVLRCLQEQLPALAESVFLIYVDEYENLREYQQKIINTCLKHSEPPLVFNVAMKRNGMKTKDTLEGEAVMDVADYRQHDLDDYLHRYDFAVFAAEIMFLRFAMAGADPGPIDVDTLRDPARLPLRQSKGYQEEVVRRASSMLPGLQEDELAAGVLNDAALCSKLRGDTEAALRSRHSGLDVARFVRTSTPEARRASVVAPSIMRRKAHSPEMVLHELDNLEAGKGNRFTGKTGWLHNNFVGCLLRLYAPYDRACPFYAGFKTFIQLARGNLRHFLELCYRSLRSAPPHVELADLTIPPREQAEAARQASTTFLGEIRTFNPLGNRLHAFVLTLGNLFAVAHRRPTQSQPEISHFSVAGGLGALGKEDQDFLTEALKWSVLAEETETKVKDPLQPSGTEYVLNPIYAPYFHITYRKRRKLDLTVRDMHVLIQGDFEERRSLLKRFATKWDVEPEEGELTLFSHLLRDSAHVP